MSTKFDSNFESLVALPNRASHPPTLLPLGCLSEGHANSIASPTINDHKK